MKVLFLEPFHGGSHKDFAQGLCRYLSHAVDLHTLPGRFWKWRMRGAALHFIGAGPNPAAYDVLLVSGLLSLADFKALAAPACPPAIVYFHENQLTYPAAAAEERDLHFAFTNITTALAADRVLFNSNTHCGRFFKKLPEFLQIMPDYQPSWVIEEIRAKTAVCYPGCEFPASGAEPPIQQNDPPLIVWNHRWEFDKQPERFFSALEAVAEKGIDFSLAVLGESYRTAPPVFDRAYTRFAGRIRHWGYVEEKAAYQQWLQEGTLVISTAIQENFGISVIEAVRFGCLPLLPKDLVYPEILPAFAHAACLYESFEELVEKTTDVLIRPQAYAPLRRSLAAAMQAFSWEQRIPCFEDQLAAAAASGRRPAGADPGSF